jgi:hypothetical protein
MHQRQLKEKAIQRVADFVKKEAQDLKIALDASESDGQKKAVFADKHAEKLTWRGFAGFRDQKNTAEYTVWPKDDEFIGLSENIMANLDLSHIHANVGASNVESLTLELN